MNDTLAQVTANKVQTDTYVLRWKGQHWWAIFYVDASHGALSVQSDFGDYSYRWGSPGKCFKTFLTDIDDSYLMSKLGQGDGKYFYDTESMRKLTALVQEKCAEQGKAFEDYESALEEIDDCHCYDSNLFFHLAYTNDELSDLFEDGDPHELGDCIVRGHSPQLRGFAEKLWPSFVAVLKQELAAQPPP